MLGGEGGFVSERERDGERGECGEREMVYVCVCEEKWHRLWKEIIYVCERGRD